MLTANQYVDLINLATREYSASPIVIDDKGDFLEDVNSTKDDWLRIARARAVFGAYSTFTLSAAILNPDLELRIVDPRQYLGPDLLGPVDIESIEKIANAFENINWKRLY
ncbi:MAG: hypothetical protein EBU08_08875 [Micrococcales bacterium]|nr:hypothetical protein [Micrococcales bacterium]